MQRRTLIACILIVGLLPIGTCAGRLMCDVDLRCDTSGMQPIVPGASMDWPDENAAFLRVVQVLEALDDDQYGGAYYDSNRELLHVNLLSDSDAIARHVVSQGERIVVHVVPYTIAQLRALKDNLVRYASARAWGRYAAGINVNRNQVCFVMAPYREEDIVEVHDQFPETDMYYLVDAGYDYYTDIPAAESTDGLSGFGYHEAWVRVSSVINSLKPDEYGGAYRDDMGNFHINLLDDVGAVYDRIAPDGKYVFVHKVKHSMEALEKLQKEFAQYKGKHGIYGVSTDEIHNMVALGLIPYTQENEKAILKRYPETDMYYIYDEKNAISGMDGSFDGDY